MNWKKMTRELLKSMRGKRSQNFINNRLGYSFNQMSRWETGRSQVSWKDFVQLSEVCRIDLANALEQTFGFRGAPRSTSAILKHLVGQHELRKMSSHLKISRHVLGRWLSGSTQPSLQKLLYVMNALSPLLLEFLASLTNVSELPSLKKNYARMHLEKQLNYKYPYLGAVLRCLELNEYKSLAAHVPGFISHKIGVTLEQEQLLVADLLSLGILKNKNKKLQPQQSRIDTRGDFAGQMNIRKYWLKRSLVFAESLKTPPSRSNLGYLVFSVSDSAQKEIQKRYFDFFQEVRTIIEQDSESSDEVSLLNIQLLSLNELVQVDA